jgi:hypothetical protein
MQRMWIVLIGCVAEKELTATLGRVHSVVHSF